METNGALPMYCRYQLYQFCCIKHVSFCQFFQYAFNMFSISFQYVSICFNMYVLSSRHASAQAITSKRYICATSPVNTYLSGVKTDFRRKTDCSRAVYQSIRKIPTARTTEISMSSQTSIQFFPVDGPKRAVSAVFRALGGQNGTFTF